MNYGALVAVTMLTLAGFAALSPPLMSWVYIAAVLAFEIWLIRRIAREGRAPAMIGEAPYHFTEEEAQLIGQYRFYFTYPAIAEGASSVLGALGITALLLAPWLTYKLAFLQAALIGLNLFAVARLTKMLVPVMTLRIAARSGDRGALRKLKVHETAWAKIRAGNG
jgi:hypothetical protein